ncbi:MAG TPA: VCBS repeat-containing protein [Candidatus Baltobacteraceae bacterium]|nr:VCBS repeat-containing protein [Candidatus Baltobacteraceae bacterium]
MRLFFSCLVILLGTMAGMLPCAAQLQWHPEEGFKWAELQARPEGPPGFTLLSPEQTGITFTNPLNDWAIASNRILANGSGVAIGDIDGDGWPDIFLAALDGHCALYKNLGGYKFKDITATSGIDCSRYICRGAVFADINGDGWLDLLVSTTGAGVLCFTNKGDGTFAECSQYAGTRTSYGALTMTLADIDGDGTLDLYVADNRVENSRDVAALQQIQMLRVNGRDTVAPSMSDRFVFTNGTVQEYGEPSLLYLNDGKGRFTPVSWTNGAFLDESGQPLTAPPRDWSLTAAFHDVNGDGAPDLYVCDDYWTPDRFWINDGKGHFRACPPLALRHTSKFSMGVDFADLDRSGRVDFFVVDMLNRDLGRRRRTMLTTGLFPSEPGMIEDRPQIPCNTLFRNRGDGTFEEIAAYAGVTASDWSWQPVFLDVDLDGYEDVIIPTGFVGDENNLDTMHKKGELRRLGKLVPPKFGSDGKPVQRSRQEEMTQEFYEINRMTEPIDTPIVGFRNLGNWKFQDTGATWGLTQPGIHQGIAVADLGNDGYLDFVVNNLGAAAGVYHNHCSAPRVAVRLKGLPPNTQGIGAKIKLLSGAVPMQSQEVVCGGLYLSGSDPLRVFAAGKSQSMTIEVTWRNGRHTVVGDVKPNRLYEIDEAGAIAPPAPPPPVEVKPFFKDVSYLLSHQHHEESYNDYARQPLLPWQLSREGPGVAWVDLLDDGREELVVGSSRGGSLGIFLSDGRGGLKRQRVDSRLPEDLAGIVGWVRRPHERGLVMGRSNYTSRHNCPSASVLGFLPASWKLDLPENPSSTGPVAVADVYGEGSLALFVGGRVLPDRYPQAADSCLYRNVGGELQLDAENTAVLRQAGLVTGAVWSDLDGDGFPDLILACEWGPIRVFKNQAGHLREITHDLGLDRYTGLWRGVTTGDIDGDGRMDIIAANWGLNSEYQATSNQPAQLYFGDFTDRGALDLIETVYDPASRALIPRRMRDALGSVYPPLMGRYPTQMAYTEATLDQVLALLPIPAEHVQATTLASTIFFNRGDHFEAAPLPMEAQLAPAFSVNVGDFDGDGNEDIFLSQNFSELAPFASSIEFQPYDFGRRLDAGRGLWLRGTGAGKLEAVPGQSSGVLVYGEQRGAALGDFDGDGRVDLVVSQNGAETKLYQNVLGKPGLRVRLAGPPGNPDGVGATMRLVLGTRMGPAREIHGGSGYWSQDSVVQVMACPEIRTQIWIRWPGGKTTTGAVPAGAREITVDAEGKVTVVR